MDFSRELFKLYKHYSSSMNLPESGSSIVGLLVNIISVNIIDRKELFRVGGLQRKQPLQCLHWKRFSISGKTRSINSIIWTEVTFKVFEPCMKYIPKNFVAICCKSKHFDLRFGSSRAGSAKNTVYVYLLIITIWLSWGKCLVNAYNTKGTV